MLTRKLSSIKWDAVNSALAAEVDGTGWTGKVRASQVLRGGAKRKIELR